MVVGILHATTHEAVDVYVFCIPFTVLDHPFLSGKVATRLIGSSPPFEVFLSYRVAADAKKVEMFYNSLTAAGKKVWWDKKCLLNGMPWEEGFCKGLINSRAFVCLISADAINHSTNTRSSFTKLTKDSPCDNVLLEHQVALELRDQGMLEYIFPVFIGSENASDPTKLDRFDFSNLAGLSNTVVVDAVLEKMREHMDREALGSPLHPQRTVKQTMDAITANQGGFMEGDIQASVVSITQGIVDMLSSATSQAPDSSSSVDLLAELAELRAQLKEKEEWSYRLQIEEEEMTTLREEKEKEGSKFREKLDKQKARVALDTNELKNELEHAILQAWAASLQDK